MTAKEIYALRQRQFEYAQEIAHAQWQGADECIKAGYATETDKAIHVADRDLFACDGDTPAGVAVQIFLFPPETDAFGYFELDKTGWRQLDVGENPSFDTYDPDDADADTPKDYRESHRWDDLPSLEWDTPKRWEIDTEMDTADLSLFGIFETDYLTLAVRYTTPTSSWTPVWDAVAAAALFSPFHDCECQGWLRDRKTGAVREWEWVGNEVSDAAAAE